MDIAQKKIAVLDFGSQYTQLIARRIRECKVYCEILPYNITLRKLRYINPAGIVLSGSPAGIYQKNSPMSNKGIFALDVPILGICYGMQLIAHLFNGKISKSQKREYGKSRLTIDADSPLFYGIRSNTTVWMSHGDHIDSLPEDFLSIARTSNSPFAAIQRKGAKIFGIQFHPEVTHTTQGAKILSNFVNKICGCPRLWTMKSFLEYAISDIRKKTKGKKTICAVSGGVDSTVAAVLMNRAIGKNLTSIFVNNGLLRKGEYNYVMKILKGSFHVNIKGVNEEDRFLNKLVRVSDPEKKRKIIGKEFIKVFEREAKKIGQVKYLVQGTLYPDVIESVSSGGPSSIIKSHHNVGGLPRNMNLKLIEPLKWLFKDEVRALGKALDIPEKILKRHPFPGPGLSVRIIGEVKKKYLKILREADSILLQEIDNDGIGDSMWQIFTVFLPIKTVGVMGDKRTYENVIAIRAVSSSDGMTADWVRLPYTILEKISNRIINEVKGVNRVVYDISSKPPSTIEWE